MDYWKLQAMREVRLWLKEIIVPAALVVAAVIYKLKTGTEV